MESNIEFSTLPLPLTADEEADIINRIGSDPSLKTKLIERNLYLLIDVVKKFDNSKISIEDLISLGTIGIIKAINTLPSDSNINLVDYITQNIEDELTNYIKTMQKYTSCK